MGHLVRNSQPTCDLARSGARTLMLRIFGHGLQRNHLMRSGSAAQEQVPILAISLQRPSNAHARFQQRISWPIRRIFYLEQSPWSSTSDVLGIALKASARWMLWMPWPHTRHALTSPATKMVLWRHGTSGAPTQVIVLPDATHDAGFAMTSSFSTMLLTALALFDAPCDLPNRMTTLANQLDDLLPKFAAGPRPDRVVYVGAGPLAFAAREAALKVMELSAGQIPALWDSTLGFRHGPKAFVTDGTDITVFTSPNTPTSRYDADLAAELRTQFPYASVETIGAGGDIDIAMPFGAAWAAPLCVASAQVRGVVWSHNLGLNVDDPFSGQSTLSRVVSGVKLYPVVS